MDATPSFAARAIALAAFVGLLAAATFGAYNAILPTGLDNQVVTVHVIGQDQRMAPGGAVAAAVAITSPAAENRTARITVADPGGLVVETPATMDLAAGEGGGAWVTLLAPEGTAAGRRTAVVHVQVGDESRPRVARISVNVEQPSEVVKDGDNVVLRYTGRLSDGSVFGTNVADVAESHVPKASLFNPDQDSFEPLTGPAGPGATSVAGFWEELVGVGVGHTTTFTLEPHRAFGNATLIQTDERATSVNRTIEWPMGYDGQRQFFQGIINETTEEGDTVHVGREGDQTWPFIVTHLNDTHAAITIDAEMGETFTHYPQWPGSSEVVFLNDTIIRFRVTPTTELFEPFTWRPQWPNATEVTEVAEDNIWLRHTPPVGLTYTQASQDPRQPGPTLTVKAVEKDVILLERPNPAVLAGETVTFDVTVMGVDTHGSHTH